MLSYRENLYNVVGGGPDRIDVLLAEDPHEAHSVCLEDPLLQGLELTILSDDDLLLIVSLGQVHVHLEEKSVTFDFSLLAGICFCYRLEACLSICYLADLLDALKRHVCQHVGLDAPQEHIVVHFVHHLLILDKEITGLKYKEGTTKVRLLLLNVTRMLTSWNLFSSLFMILIRSTSFSALSSLKIQFRSSPKPCGKTKSVIRG